VLVAGSYLGSLSHALTSLDALRRRHLVIKALVVNETPGSMVLMADTVTTLKRFAASTPIVALPRSAIADPTFAEIAALL
jgi:dethiobiotin synthetase